MTLMTLAATIITQVDWPEVGRVLNGALTVIRYLFGFGFLVAAIKFFWQVAKAVNRFVQEQEDLSKYAKRLAADAKEFADRMTTIIEQHDDWLYEHESQLAVINHELGIEPDKHRPHRRTRRRRRSDRDLPTDSDAASDTASDAVSDDDPSAL